MDVSEIKAEVELIAQIGDGDYEAAHGREDDLYRKVLEFIRQDAPEPYSSMAAETLKTQDIEFARYCA